MNTFSSPGAHWDGETTHFVLETGRDAVRVTLCLFDREGAAAPTRRVELRRRAAGTWYASVSGAGPGQLYGYRVHGPWNPRRGQLFNPAKLLVDPMARAITGEGSDSDTLRAFEAGAARPEMTYNGADSAAVMPKSVVIDPAFDWRGDAPPAIDWRDTVIYECHVKGLTRRHPDVPERLRGTYLGLVEPAVLDHLKGLGVTALELLPVAQIWSETPLRQRGLGNYWGYSPLGFCAPHAGYATDHRGEQVREFKTMVRELHRAGFEVLLDVVFNHTAEGGLDGPVLSFKGLGNSSFYRLRGPSLGWRYRDFTGCGNTLDLSRGVVRKIILESLRYWVRDMHVDGFRFDLASVLGRRNDGFDPRAPLFEAMAEDPDLSRVKLIAEPWDLGWEGYQVGRFPPSWTEWNDRYRDTVRRFWRGDAGMLGEMATRFAGSRDLFAAKGPRRSLHYVSCHDGYTLHDLVSYDHKHNEANGEDNRDGNNSNYSYNWGHEGPSDDPAIRAHRERARRNLFATLALSQGVPMLHQGDELGRTQLGNNNAYCQDNDLSWLDWELDAVGQDFLAFVRRALSLRRRFGQLRRERFPEPEEILWWHPDGRELRPEDWENAENRAVAVFLPGDQDLLFLMNGSGAPVHFRLPDPPERWRPPSWQELLSSDAEPATLSPEITLEAFTLCVFGPRDR